MTGRSCPAERLDLVVEDLVMPKLPAVAVAAIFFIATVAQAQPISMTYPKAANLPQICTNGKLDPGKLVSWYYYTYPQVAADFTTVTQLQQAFQNRTAETGQRRSILNGITAAVNVMTDPDQTVKPFQLNVPHEQLNAEEFLSGHAGPVVISCIAPPKTGGPTQGAGVTPAPAAKLALAPPNGATPAPAAEATETPGGPGATAATTPSPLAWLTNFRIRGISDDLIFSRDSKAFSSASSATLSYASNGPTKTATGAMQTAVGYDFNFPPTRSGYAGDIIPFAAVDRNLTTVAGKLSSSSKENVYAGVVGDVTLPFPDNVAGASVVSLTGEHVWADEAKTQMNFLHLVDLPMWNGVFNNQNYFPVNTYWFIPCCSMPVKDTWFAFSPILDFRADLGFYSDRGPMPSKNRDFGQVGTQFGIAISLDRISSDIKITNIWMGSFSDARKNISLFEAVWTLNLFSKEVGLQASYQNGNLESTAQRSQQWLVSLSVKY